MGKTVTSVKRALSILELFLDNVRSLSVPEIIARLDLPRTTAHDLVQTLLSNGYLERLDSDSHRYVLGVRVFELGGVYTSRLDITEEARKVARKISDTCDETVQVAILEGADVVFIIRVDSSQTLRLVSAVGSRLPAHLTAVGKTLLAEITDKELSALYKGQTILSTMTPNSIGTVDKLITELKETRERGYAIDDCESNEYARCVAAPIFDRSGKACAAISITVPVTRKDAQRQKHLAKLVLDGAREISVRLGYSRTNAVEEY